MRCGFVLFVLMPMVSIALSVWLTGEVVTVSFVLGAAVTLVGVWLGAISGSSRATAPQPTVALERAAGSETADCAPNC